MVETYEPVLCAKVGSVVTMLFIIYNVDVKCSYGGINPNTC